MKKGSNYDKFKNTALQLFLDYDQEELIKRLSLEFDDEYIYMPFCKYVYRLNRKTAELLKRDLLDKKESASWMETDSNDALTFCDILCHTKEPLKLSPDFKSLSSLNAIQSGYAQSSLGGSMFSKIEKHFDGNTELLKTACEALGGFPAGKGDVAYEIPLFDCLSVRITFYESDDEFDAKLTILFPSDICNFMFYETLYYATGIVMDRLMSF